MQSHQLSITEYAVLGVLAESPKHGFAISNELAAGAQVGRVLTVRRPLTYRALNRLVEAGCAEPVHTEPGRAGPMRVIHRATSTGRRRLRRWLGEPVGHIRDMRIEFQLKLALVLRSGASPLPLITAQREALQPTLAALELADDGTLDHLDLWRRHNAAAAGAYLERLAATYQGTR